MSKELTYKIETLNLLNQLSNICPSVIIRKNGDKININRKSESETVAFNFEAPVEDFYFTDEEVTFLDYPEFYQLISAFKNPEIIQDENKFIISKDKAKIRYILSDPESIKESPKPLKKFEPDCTFNLTNEEIKNITKMIGLINSDNTNITNSDGKITITLLNVTHENTFEKEFDFVTSNNESFDFIFPSEVFTFLPSGDYEVSVVKEGLIVFTLKNDRITLKIITSEMEER